ncbi:hypothetical protein MMC27_007208 [Xylographa pallens]|nr:hypothetical protein [Xylographa pallens]
MQATSLDNLDGASKHELVRHSPFEASLSSHQSSNFNYERSSAGWTHEDDELLMLSRAQAMNWAPIANTYFPNKTPNACRKRHERLMEKRFATNWDGVSLEDLARAYMETRETMWKILANKIGEKWDHVETKCMEKGLKTLQSAARPSRAKQTFSRSNSPLSISEFDDSGMGPEPSRLTPISLKRKVAGADAGTDFELTPRADRPFRVSDTVASDHAVQVNGAIPTVGRLPDLAIIYPKPQP